MSEFSLFYPDELSHSFQAPGWVYPHQARSEQGPVPLISQLRRAVEISIWMRKDSDRIPWQGAQDREFAFDRKSAHRVMCLRSPSHAPKGAIWSHTESINRFKRS